MKTKFAPYLGGACLALAIVVGLQAQERSAAPSNPTSRAWQHLAFEHHVDGGIDDADLARKIVGLGEKGWELVDVEGVLESGTTTKRVFYFKRPR